MVCETVARDPIGLSEGEAPAMALPCLRNRPSSRSRMSVGRTGIDALVNGAKGLRIVPAYIHIGMIE